MSRKLLAGAVAALVLALGVWLVPTAFGSGGGTTSARATTVAASAAPSPTRPSPGTGCTHAPATSVQ
jgi:hypothetical protein